MRLQCCRMETHQEGKHIRMSLVRLGLLQCCRTSVRLSLSSSLEANSLTRPQDTLSPYQHLDVDDGMSHQSTATRRASKKLIT